MIVVPHLGHADDSSSVDLAGAFSSDTAPFGAPMISGGSGCRFHGHGSLGLNFRFHPVSTGMVGGHFGRKFYVETKFNQNTYNRR